MKSWLTWLMAGILGVATWWFWEGRRGNSLVSLNTEAEAIDNADSHVETDENEDSSRLDGGISVSDSDEALAARGNREAMRRLGDTYRTGQDAKQNYAEAVKWYRLAAEKGDAEAQLRLGECYRDGLGMAQDTEWAKIWFKSAAQQGVEAARLALESLESNENSEEIREVETCRKLASEGDTRAQCLMGEWCLSGRVTGSRDEKEGAKWFRLAAEAGNPEGLRQWGNCLADGCGVEKDEVAAKRWLKEAAILGSKDAREDFCRRWRWEWERADDEKIALFEKAAGGDVRAQGQLGMHYLLGTRAEFSTNASWDNFNRSGVFRRPDEYGARQALRWLKMGAKGGDADAMYWLGLCFAEGIGVEADEKMALRLLATAEHKGLAKAGVERRRRLGNEGVLREQVGQGNRAAQFKLGTILAGRGEHEGIALLRDLADRPDGLQAALWLEQYYTGIDKSLMVHWCHRAADLGDLGAMRRMLDHDPQHALSWCKKMYEHGGGAPAAQAIGLCYEKGVGCPRDYEEAKRWYARAGDSMGEERMKRMIARSKPTFMHVE